jgi:translation initiation factor IF-2
VTANDIEEAITCNAEIFTFGVEANFEAALMQKDQKIVPKVHRLIHNFLKDFEESAIARKKGGLIKGTEKGKGLVAEVYQIKSKKGSEEPIFIPGVRLTSGKISKTNKLYIFRNGTPVTGEMFAKSIKVFKK